MKLVCMDAADEMCHLEVRDSVTANYDDDVGAKEGQEDDVLGDVGGN